MAVAVDPVLEARLDSQYRQPKLTIDSSNFQSNIPYDGNSFDIVQSDTFSPALVSLSTGRLATVFINDTGDPEYMYTDESRAYWIRVDISGIFYLSNYELYSVSMTEMVNGNIGVVFINQYRDIYYAVITPLGVVVTTKVLVEATGYPDKVVVIKLSNDTYIMAYSFNSADGIIYTRTCSNADFSGWSASTNVSLAPLTTTDRRVSNPCLFEASGGDLFLLFDIVTHAAGDDTVTNIYSMISTDFGVSWGTPEARTTGVNFGENRQDPVLAQDSSGEVYLIYTKNSSVLHMDKDTTNFISDTTMWMAQLHYVEARDKLIAISVGGIHIIDPSTWTIEKNFHTASIPALSGAFGGGVGWRSGIGGINKTSVDGKYIAIARQEIGSTGLDLISVINWVDDTVTNYVIRDTSIAEVGGGPGGTEQETCARWGLDANIEVDLDAQQGLIGLEVYGLDLHESLDRLYVGFADGYLWQQKIHYGYIDLTEAFNPISGYNMTMLTPSGGAPYSNNHDMIQHEMLMQDDQYPYGGMFKYIPEYDWIIQCMSGGGSLFSGFSGGSIMIYDASNDCATVKDYNRLDYSSMSYYAANNFVFYNSKLYCGFGYRVQAPHNGQRGLMVVNILTDDIQFYRPTYETKDQYVFYDFVVDEYNSILWIGGEDGVSKFNMNTHEWELFNESTLPGIRATGLNTDAVRVITRDPITGNIMFGTRKDHYADGNTYGVTMFNEVGDFDQLQYVTATKTVGYTWGSEANLTLGTVESQAAAVFDDSDSLWTIWNHRDLSSGNYSLYWDSESGGVDVVNDITGEVSMQWKVKEENVVTFALARGHLYDPQNSLSVLGVALQKGRKITVTLGEIIGEVDYLVTQGTYIVDSTQLDYKRGDHPVLRVTARGKTSVWKEKKVPVSILYTSQGPDEVIAHMIATHTELDLAEYSIPVLSNTHELESQWIDKTLYEMMEEVLDHFFYVLFERPDGTVTIKELDLTKAVDETYSDLTKIVGFTPDDSYSTYINRITVKGETLDFTEITHNEEQITAIAGTTGWWEKSKVKKVWYSDDRARECRNPRLEVIDSIEGYGLLLDQLASGEGGEAITYEDPNRLYIKISIDIPDLTWAFVGAVAAVIIIGVAAVSCILWCGIFISALSMAMSIVFYILGAVASYSYEIWARPIGRVKTSIQYQADDIAFQQKLNGEIVEEEIDDPFCYTVGECQRVADGEMELVKAQRNRIKLSKVYDLRNELMDKIAVTHPFSGESMDVFITGLTRKYSKQNGVIDNIEGWRITF